MNFVHILLWFLPVFLVIFGVPFVNASPSFSNQFFDSGSGAYYPEKYYEDDTDALSIEGVFYNSDGKTLNAKLILHGKNGFVDNNILDYGMLIDSDSDFKTGINGFDYRYRVQWNNGTWTEIYEKLLAPGTPLEKTSVIKNITDPFTPDTTVLNKSQSTVDLKLDLEKIAYPERYAVVFYAEGNLTGKIQLIQHVMSLAIVPPPNFSITTYPLPLSFESSTEKAVHIFVNADLTENAVVYYNISSESNGVTIKKITGNSIVLKNGKAEIPVLLKDAGHDDIRIHELHVSLTPWYNVNPETNDVERGGEIFESYNFRNQQKTEIVKVVWTSLPEPGLDIPMLVQVLMLVGTFAMIIFGVFTYVKNSKLQAYSRNEKHAQQIIGVYEIMLSLISKVDYNTKHLTLKFPEDEDNRLLVRAGPVELHTSRDIELVELNSRNVRFYDSALKHLKNYAELWKKWSILSKSISQYDDDVNLIKQEIQKTCLEFIKEKMPRFREADGFSGKVFHINHIEFEAYEALEDAMHDRIPILTLNEQQISLSDQYEQIEPGSKNDETEYIAYLSSTLFSSNESLPDEVHQILGCVLNSSLKEKYTSLIALEIQARSQLDAFKHDMKSLVKELKLGVELKGKCKIGY